MNAYSPDNYGMSAEEAQRRDQLIYNLLSHPENPNNASVAQLISQGPYQMNNGSPSPQGYQQPQTGYPSNHDPLSGGQPPRQQQVAPSSYAPPPTMGSGDLMNSAPIQGPQPRPAINPTNPGYTFPDNATGNPQQQVPAINININSQPYKLQHDENPPQLNTYPSAGNVTPLWTEQAYQDQQRRTQGGAPDLGGPRYNLPQRPLPSMSPLERAAAGAFSSVFLPPASPHQGDNQPSLEALPQWMLPMSQLSGPPPNFSNPNNWLGRTGLSPESAMSNRFYPYASNYLGSPR